MLNQRGGHVLFGVTPTGGVTGQQVSERTLEEVSAEIQRIDPPAFPAVERIHIAGDLEVVAVRVSQGSARPYQYRGTAYRRVGNKTRAMSADEYNRMLFERMHSEQRWENQPATGWSVEDLDVAEIRNTVYRRRATTVGRYGNPDSDQRGEIGHRTSRSNARGLKTGHRARSHNPRKRPFRLDPLILNGLTQSDEVRTRAGRNGEYGPNRE